MHWLLSLAFFIILSLLAFGQGTRSTDNTEASEAEASLSGTRTQEEEAQKMEEKPSTETIDDIERELFQHYDPRKVQEDESQDPPVNKD